MTKIRINLLLVLVGLALLSACSSAPYRYTHLVDVQPNKEKPAKPPYHSVLVAVLVKEPWRATVENALVKQLRARGVQARAALPIYGNHGVKGKSRAQISQLLREHGFDSAIGVHLKHKKIRNVSSSGGPSVSAPAAAGMNLRAEPLGPNFSIHQSTYISKIDFWDTRQQAMVWMATSIVHNPKGVKEGADSFAKTVINQLTQAGLFAQ